MAPRPSRRKVNVPVCMYVFDDVTIRQTSSWTGIMRRAEHDDRRLTYELAHCGLQAE